MKITSAEFEQDVGRYQEAAQSAPVLITRDARTHAVLISGALFEVIMNGRIARYVEDLDDATLSAIAGSAVPDEFSGLDELVKDWKP